MNWKLTAYLGILALIFLDSFFINIPIGPLRMTLLRMAILSVFAIMIYRLILKKDVLNISGIKFPLIFLGIWFYYGAMAITWSFNKAAAIKELYYFFLFILLIVVLIYLLQKIYDSWVSASLWLVGAGIVLIALLELAFGIHLPTSRYVIEAERFVELDIRRATAFFYNENDLSVFLVLVLPFFLTRLLSRPISIKLINLLAILAIVGINYMNDARLSLIAIFLQVVAFVLLAQFKQVKKGVRLALVSSPILIGAIAWFVLPALVNIDLFEGIREGRGSASHRFNLYLNGLYATFQSFMLGVGPGNFPEHIDPYRFNTSGFTNPHNWWLEVLSSYGLMIFAGYVAFFIFIVVKLFSIYRFEKSNGHLALSLLLSYIGFVIACLGPSSLFYFWPMWFFYGVALAFIAKHRIAK
ncbi:O-antigen ligase family protein [Mesobacillus subterraneus]|uniref:O-antigen ligase family protein n=1 Tax=Mesobacillus subterraneus TaxID=285983 RepID=UPI00203F24AF|nr:O-antigen ligase family protein [Mesobacillus subterraneus]MCM3663619.1 O-antigen ligase family protein [Mesobacillus subterraneus]MCM3683385.1 O-antigen ligase family protein [Mesobacillus subterraneus]